METKFSNDWEPLPPRRKKVRNSNACVNFSNSADKQESPINSIAASIVARSEQKNEEAKLEDQDGCSSEFYEYLDHTADVQLHAWGADLRTAFENVGPCMFNYMTDLSRVREESAQALRINVSGHDWHTLLYAYLDELLFRFCSENFCCVRVSIEKFDRDSFSLDAIVHGEKYDRSRHTQGTEVKAITYSNMQVHEMEDRADIFVIVDI